MHRLGEAYLDSTAMSVGGVVTPGQPMGVAKVIAHIELLLFPHLRRRRRRSGCHRLLACKAAARLTPRTPSKRSRSNASPDRSPTTRQALHAHHGARAALSANRDSPKEHGEFGTSPIDVPGVRVVQAVEFVSDDPTYAGAMTMTWEVTAVEEGTRVDIIADNFPGWNRRA